MAGRRWTKDGAVVINGSEERSQARNREIARDRLAELVRQATAAPKRRVKRKVPLGSRRRRLEEKKARGEVKEGRGSER